MFSMRAPRQEHECVYGLKFNKKRSRFTNKYCKNTTIDPSLAPKSTHTRARAVCTSPKHTINYLNKFLLGHLVWSTYPPLVAGSYANSLARAHWRALVRVETCRTHTNDSLSSTFAICWYRDLCKHLRCKSSYYNQLSCIAVRSTVSHAYTIVPWGTDC